MNAYIYIYTIATKSLLAVIEKGGSRQSDTGRSAMAKQAWRMSPSWLALALLLALLAAAMEHSLAAAEEAASSAPASDAPAAAAAAEQEAVDDEDAPAPAPAIEEESKSLGAKAKAGLHHMMEGLSAGKAKLECKVLKSCPASDAPPAS